VLKVESPRGGDGIRAMPAPAGFNATHAALNRGKRSLALDLRHERAAAVLTALVRQVDVVVESHRPGQLDAMGLGYEAMSAENPRLVWCSLTAFGDVGPNRDAPGHDLTYLGASGLLGRLGDGPPTPPGAVLSLPLAALMACVGILAALPDVERTGRGVRLDTYMVDSAMWVLSEDVARAATAPAPGWGTFSSRNVYECQDGRSVTVTASAPKDWATLCEALGTPELAGHQLGIDDEAPVIERLAEAFRAKPASAWLAHPGLAGGVGPVNEPADLVADPQLVERGSIVELATSGAKVLANPIRYLSASGAAASAARSDPPELGADTDAALAAAGFTADEIAGLRADGALG
jgi:alpha-methylacyl-CoA racemase